MITPHDMTHYARSINPVTRTEEWTRTQISGVLWEDRKAANVLRSGLLEADKVAVYVPLARVIQPISIGDILVKGLVSDEIGPGFTVSDLKAKYANTVVVKSVDCMDYGSAGLQHYQIGAS